MKTRKRVLILTADAGFGHRKAADAIAAALDELYGEQCTVVVVNPLHTPEAPDLVRQLEAGYDEMVVDDPALYRFAYHATDAPLVSDIIAGLTERLLNDTMLKLVEQHHPDVVVTTYPAYAQSVARVIELSGLEAALAVVITDLVEVHSLWYSPAATMHFVPTSQIRQQAIEHKISATHVRITGLPVHPAFSGETDDKVTLRRELGWDTECLTGLIVGSTRVRQTGAIVHLLDRSELGLQMAVVTGGNSEMFEQLRNMSWKGMVHIYGRVDNMPQLMKASDFIVTKAGGLVVSEALACGLPMLLSEALPGQEVGNARYVTEGGAGAWTPGAVEVLATVFSWLKDEDGQLDVMRSNALKLGKSHAAYAIAEGIWGLA